MCLQVRSIFKTAFSLILCILLASPAICQNHTIQTDDNLALHINPSGRISHVSIDSKPLLKACDSEGGLILEDFQKLRASQQNLIPNGSFEQGNIYKNNPDGWKMQMIDGQWTWDSAQHHNGTKAMRVHLPFRGEKKVSGNLYIAQRVIVKPQQQYLLSFWAKTQDCGGKYAPAVFVLQFNKNGQPSAAQRGIATQSGTTAWQQYWFDFSTSPDTGGVDIYVNIYQSHGTAWFDDFTLITLPETPLQTKPAVMITTPGSISAEYADNESALKVREKYTSLPGYIQIDLEIESLKSADRTIAIGYALPIDASGWVWWDNIYYKRRITGNSTHMWTDDIEMGDGKQSIYPFNSLAGPDCALTLGIPLDQGPRIWNVRYDNKNKRFVIMFFLGISPKTTKFPNKATCSFIIYRHDHTWGMRSAAKRFYQFYPQHFVKRIPFEAHMNYALLAQRNTDTGTISFKYGNWDGTADDGTDFGESMPCFVHAHFGYRNASWPYRRPDDVPSDEEILNYVRFQQNGKETLARITHTHTGNIQYHEKKYGGLWGPKEGGWFFEFRTQEDPELGEGIPQRINSAWSRWRMHHPAFPRFHFKMSADGVMGYGGTGRKPDFRQEHLSYADVPLGFHKDSLTLGTVNLAYDLLKTFLWPDSEKKGYLITGNDNWFTRSFCYPYVDCSLIEWDWDGKDPLRTEMYTRTMSYHKIAGFEEVLHLGREAQTDPEAVRLHLHRGLLWAIYPV